MIVRFNQHGRRKYVQEESLTATPVRNHYSELAITMILEESLQQQQLNVKQL